jgi:hypothetical protein
VEEARIFARILHCIIDVSLLRSTDSVESAPSHSRAITSHEWLFYRYSDPVLLEQGTADDGRMPGHRQLTEVNRQM